jgi:hypothetical protein
MSFGNSGGWPQFLEDFVAKRGRRGGTLAALEQELNQIDARRRAIVQQMKAAFAHLTAGSAVPMGGLMVRARVGNGGAKRNVSPAVRARLSALAKARWAKAKKEGKKRLG